jgi:nitrogen fixation/metabolism regulation signal transduction histidine kinase
MAARGRIRRRLALAIVLTALIPVCAAILLARNMVRQTAERFFQPEIGQRLNESLELYRELASTLKARMRADAEAIANDPRLSRALASDDRGELGEVLRDKLERYADLASLAVQREETLLASADRGRPPDEEHEFALNVEQPLEGSDARLLAVFATDRARFDQLKELSSFVEAYAQIEGRRDLDERTYLYAFAALLGITIVAAVGVGSALAQGVSRRLARLAVAIERVGGGDLSLRVADRGRDEIAELAAAFNTMLSEIEASRGRIEYLSRIAAWQGMAQRLAHEIKNPLTPIQLAVQEIHQRYRGDDEGYRQVVNTTLEVVEAEVGTLRRLVTEFSDFARLPTARLEEDDLFEYLETQRALGLFESGTEGARIELDFELPHEPGPVRLDRQMMRRVLINLVRNAAQAIGGERSVGHIRISAGRAGPRQLFVAVDDDGPGVPDAIREQIFDPYVTHKRGGTGLGLAIVKKVVVEHDGTIEVSRGPLGGARMCITLPLRAQADGHATAGPESSSRSRGEALPPLPDAQDLAE